MFFDDLETSEGYLKLNILEINQIRTKSYFKNRIYFIAQSIRVSELIEKCPL